MSQLTLAASPLASYWWIAQMKHALPPTIFFFFVGFNLCWQT
jgi:hypothetical protein